MNPLMGGMGGMGGMGSADMSAMMASMFPMMGGMAFMPMGAMQSAGGCGTSSPSGSREQARPYIDAGPELVMQAVKDLPAEMASDPRGFLLRCAVPSSLAGALRDRAGVEEIEGFTDARVSIAPGADEAMCIMNIEGSLLNVCAAYILMMVRYMEAEEDAEQEMFRNAGQAFRVPG
mmetsp:Transcript_66369/g.144648  ORF Transcript_66369/g.144648 Transcript_66369/m.144648 type:complete len:176 (+) Transcript_66369:1-528(+)